MANHTSWEIYRAVYAVLDNAYDAGEKTGMLRAFLSDANPGIWTDAASADPAVYSRFGELFLERHPLGNADPYAALDVVEEFLKEMENEYAFAKEVPGEGLWRPFDLMTNLLTWEAFFAEHQRNLEPKTFTKDELAALTRLVGKEIGSVVRSDVDRVEIRFDGGICAVRNVYTTVANGKAVDDFCVLRVGEEESPSGQEDAIELGASIRTCRDILIAYAKEVELHDGRPRYSDVHARAVALDFGGECLVMARQHDILEALDVYMVEDPASLFSDFHNEEPYEEDGTPIETQRSIAWCSVKRWNESDALMDLFPVGGEASALVPAECPVCGERDAHLLMHSQRPEFKLGTIWAWCGTCRSYAHASCHVPVWWENAGFLELGELCSDPDYPSRFTSEIDEWVNMQAGKYLKEQR